ncbi:23S rRNA (adenine(2503)-C(2))-methyltransferase RlmN [Nitriliruptoria bacterium AS10]|nr:23S rRNA (adenine(2503)-C(2))-methyltransferase RlmN [Salsipaludibacter albus]
MLDPYDLDHDGIAALLEELDQPSYRADQVAEWLDRGVDDPHQMTNLPTDLRASLAARFGPTRPRLVAHSVADAGRTHKLLLEYHDGVAIETVLMLYPDRATVCISTQAGCAMGCPFCATGQAGFRRQLTAGEVIRQVMVAHAVLASGQLSAAVEVQAEESGDLRLPDGHPERVTNVVFMGMGEPMANLPATLATIDYLHERLGLSARSITVSTVGLVPAIRRLAQHGKPVTLAVSLHASDDELRDDLVPPNRQHPLASVEAAMEDYRATTNRRVSIEWCLIGDVNDSDEQARGLAAIARRTRSHVNVIPMNPTPGVRWKEPSAAAVARFMSTLDEAGANATLRDTRGRDADAACGQLLASYTLGQGRRLPVAVGAAERIDARRQDPES